MPVAIVTAPPGQHALARLSLEPPSRPRPHSAPAARPRQPGRAWCNAAGSCVPRAGQRGGGSPSRQSRPAAMPRRAHGGVAEARPAAATVLWTTLTQARPAFSQQLQPRPKLLRRSDASPGSRPPRGRRPRRPAGPTAPSARRTRPLAGPRRTPRRRFSSDRGSAARSYAIVTSTVPMPTLVPCDGGCSPSASPVISQRWLMRCSAPEAGRDDCVACIASPEMTSPRKNCSVAATSWAARLSGALSAAPSGSWTSDQATASIGSTLQGVGNQPVGAGRDLAQQVAVAGGRQRRRRGGQHVQVGDDRGRRGTGHRLLEPISGDRSPERRVAVHRGGRRDHHVRSPEASGRKLGQVVHRPRADRHRHGVVASEDVLKLQHPVEIGVQRRRRGSPAPHVDARPAQLRIDALPGDRPGGRVGHDHRPVAPRRRHGTCQQRRPARQLSGRAGACLTPPPAPAPRALGCWSR